MTYELRVTFDVVTTRLMVETRAWKGKKPSIYKNPITVSFISTHSNKDHIWPQPSDQPPLLMSEVF